MRGNNDGPSPVSGSEKWLKRIHDDDRSGYDEKREELRQERIDLERDMALDISVHPTISMSRSEVLQACDYDTDKLLSSWKDLYGTGC